MVLGMPEHSMRWMQHHKDQLFNRPLSRICLPRSHDSGTYVHQFGTTFGIPENVLTQTKDIYEQLELGVRRFDIRPTLANRVGESESEWSCGHYTHTPVGWHGANCAPLDDVIYGINQFCEQNAELVILEITHVQSMMLMPGAHSERIALGPDNWTELLDKLETIKYRWKPDEKKAGKLKRFPDLKLGAFIGEGESAVVVLVEGAPNKSALLRRGFWPFNRERDASAPHEPPQPFFDFPEWSVTHMQTDGEAVGSTLLGLIGLGGKNSVLSLAKKVQDERFPKLPREMINAAVLPSAITLDRIENLDLLQFCLAVSYLSYYRDRKLFSPENNLLVFYGAKRITNTKAEGEIKDAIRRRGRYYLNNAYLSDPAKGVVKSSVVIWDNGKKAEWKREGDCIQF